MKKMVNIKSPSIFTISLTLFVITAVSIFIVFLYFISKNLVPIGTDLNASNVMSALAQIQGVIIAIIISLTLVAIQLSSQRYSTRIISIFINKKKSFWVILLIFSISIFYDIMVLWTVGKSNYFEIFIYFGILLMLFALIFLFIYIKSVMETLEPINALNMIVEGIEPSEIHDYLGDNDGNPLPLTVISDIINQSIKIFDENTIISGIEGIINIFKKTVEYYNDLYKLESINISNQENLTRINRFDDMASYFGDFITDIALNCIRNRLKFASIKSIMSLEILFKEIANFENDEIKDIAFNFIYNAYILDEEMRTFLEKEGYKNKIADPKLIDFIQSPIKCIGQMSSLNVLNKLSATYYTADYEIDMLKEITEVSYNKGIEYRTFTQIYEKYEGDRTFAGPSRFRSALRYLSEINTKIMEVIPDLNDSTNFENWRMDNYRIEKSFLIKYKKIIEILNPYILIAIQNDWQGIVSFTIDSIESNLRVLRAKNFETIEGDFIEKLDENLQELKQQKQNVT
jgi:hypothetical protein